MRVQCEVHGALGAHGLVGGPVPTHERFVVPQPEFTAPLVAAVLDWPGAPSFEVQPLTLLGDLQLVRVDAVDVVLDRLPGTPPVAGEVQFVVDLPG